MTKISLSANYYLRFTGAGLFLWVLVLTSCVSDQLPEPVVADCENNVPTYNMEVRPIIDATCAYSGCHLDVPPGLYGTYESLQSYLETNLTTFRQRVITQRADGVVGMPPNYADEGPIDLTPDQLTIIECWLDAGYPE